MTKCVNCPSTRSPEDARFCVDCGYARRQACPYHDHGEPVPLEMAGEPTVRCLVDGGCRQFFQFCPNCHRLHRLDEAACRTPRCKQHPLHELHASFESAIGDETRGASVQVPAVWERGKVKAFDGHLTMPKVLGGLSFRYGSLCFVGENSFASIAANRRRRARLDDRAVEENRVSLPAKPLSGHSLFPHPYTLRLAHGMAYILSENGPVRVDLSERTPTAQTASQDVSQNASSGDIPTWDDIDSDDAFAADPFGSSDDSEISQPLDVSSVRWQMQTTTPTRWLGVGDELGRLCIVSSESSGLFEVARVTAPEEIKAGDVIDIMVLGEDILLVLQKNLWRLREGKWEMIWQAKAELSISGVLQYGDGLLIWGYENGALVLHRFDLYSLQTIGQPVAFKARNVYAQPVRLQTRLFFFDHTPDNHAIVICNPQEPLLTPQRIPFVGDSRVVWAAGAECDGRAWLVYALDDGSNVDFSVREVTSEIGNPWTLGSRLRVRRGGHEGALAAAISDGHVAIAAATDEGAALHLFDMSGGGSIVAGKE